MFPALQEEKRQQILKDFERTEVQYLYEYGATLYAGVKETVVFLYQKYDLFIVSNCKDGYVSAFLHAHNSTPYFKDTVMSGQTGLEKGSNIKNLMKKHGIREALIKSAAVDGERFFVKTRFGKWRNALRTRKGHARIRMAPLSPTAATYFSFFKPPDWRKRSVEARRRNCAVLP